MQRAKTSKEYKETNLSTSLQVYVVDNKAYFLLVIFVDEIIELLVVPEKGIFAANDEI